MTDPQKKNNWNQLAEQIGAATPQETTPTPVPKAPVEAATPAPPPKRPPAPVKKSGWGAIASLLGIESAPAAEAPAAEAPRAEAPRAEAPLVTPPATVVEARPQAVLPTAEPIRQEAVSTPEAGSPFATPPAPDVAMETARAEALDVNSDAVEESTFGSRGSSRGRRRGGRPTFEESPDGAGAPAEPEVAAASIAPSETDRPIARFAEDDEDPLLLQQDTFVDEAAVAYDDLSDSIDNSEAVQATEAGEERPKRRRRRGRRRGRRDGDSTSETGETNREGLAKTEATPEGQDFDELGDALQPSVEEAAAEDIDNDQPTVDERPVRKRRRGRRRRGEKRDEPNVRAATTTENSNATAAEATPNTLPDDDDDDDDANEGNGVSEDEEYDSGEEHDESDSRHRKIPTWADAIGGIVDNNLATRSRNPSPPRRGRGGRGRQGDRSPT